MLPKKGSAYYKRPTSEQASPVYVENIIVRNIQVQLVPGPLPKQPAILQLRASGLGGQQENRARAPSRGLVTVFSPPPEFAMEC